MVQGQRFLYVTEYRMKVHIFGNSPSPAVAIYGLRRAAQKAEEKYGADVRLFVEKDFYVDDCLKSMPSDETAISLLKRTQEMFSLSVYTRSLRTDRN